MKDSEFYQIGELLIFLSDSLFAGNQEIRKHLLPFRITDQEELSKCVSRNADIQMLDCTGFEGSFFDLREGKLFYEEQECSTPTRFYSMPDASYVCEMLSPEQNRILLFHISADWSVIELLYDATDDNGLLLFIKLGLLFSVGMLEREGCVLHGVTMNYQGNGILVLAHSGVGKSTHTNRWEAMGLASIVNGDRCLCRKIDGTWYAYGMPWAGSSGKHEQVKVPVKWIIDLKRGPENRIEEMSAFEKEIFLLQRIFAPVTRGAQQEKAFSCVHELSLACQIKRLYCLPDEESVLLLKEQVDQAEAVTP